MPFDTDDAMFNPPVSGVPGAVATLSQYDSAGNPIVTYQDASPVGEVVRSFFWVLRLRIQIL